MFLLMLPNLLFYIFSVALIFSAVMVIISQHSVFSLLFLVSCFIFSSFLLFLLECEFLALLFIVVYVGAIAILFLFDIMMLESNQINLSRNSIKYFPVGIVFSVGLLIPILNIINNTFEDTSFIFSSFYFNNYVNWYDLIDSTNDVNVYGQILYSYFVLQFLVAGLILLLVLIGVVYLTNSFEKHTKQQSQFRQLSRKAKIF
jgi:NADH-quinone oxidoreductase subunit J